MASDESAQDTIAELQRRLNDRSLPMYQRMRVVFSLRNLKGPKAVEALASALDDPSALLKHELAYCMGQMRDRSAIPMLESVLRNRNEDPMVRHEAGEALGAIGDPSVIPTLKEFVHDPVVEVAETCQIAVGKLLLDLSNPSTVVYPSSEAFLSIDPAPPVSGMSVAELRSLLLDVNLSLFERYRALFALRNMNNEASVLAIADAFSDKSALLRHELGYVLGQMQHSAAVPALTKVLTDPSESAMVRHEAAEALGSIGDPQSLPLLTKYRADPQQVVSESCIVAVDMHEYFNSDQFQYADMVEAR
eukprot:CAMPEP_0184662048 /NCGR_PEP_ID=MMETSP0308-20130426/41310_1 /TAXON_ID=38269 /ORGANISM="Gloeochaete witrockiana, Strain SAG 46.84" /LENGTH=304 /DNA_ID=CAMNT_0027103773 /DNA_START=30 /DNA_END=944 /DNA_ORIENTATION=+